MHSTEKTVTLTLSRHAAVLTMLIVAGLSWGCGGGPERSSARADGAVAVDVAPAKQDLDQVGGTLRDLRVARSDAEIQERYRIVRAAADTLAASLSAVASQYEATVAAGQHALASHDNPATQRPLVQPAQPAAAVADLAMAMDSLLMCRAAYAQVSGAYRDRLLLMTASLDRDHSLSGMQAVTPTITGLLEDQEELRSILTDVSAKSKAVLTEIAMMPPAAR
jgi:hypothetical protein